MRTTTLSKSDHVRVRRAELAVMAAMILLLPSGRADTSAPKSDSAERRHIVLPTRTHSLPFSDAVLAGNTLYLAGKIGIDPKTGKPPAAVEEEIRLLLDDVKTTLAAAGLTMDDLVSVQVFCPDLSLYDTFNGIYRTYFTKNFPARAFIGSGRLLHGGRFEVQGVAVKR